MTQITRRELLGVLGGSLTVAAAGCAGINEGQFVVVKAPYKPHPDSGADILVRVTIENRRSDDEQGTLTVTLTYEPDDGETRTWTETRDIDQQKGSSREYPIRFSNVISGEFNRDEYSVEANLEER